MYTSNRFNGEESLETWGHALWIYLGSSSGECRVNPEDATWGVEHMDLGQKAWGGYLSKTSQGQQRAAIVSSECGVVYPPFTDGSRSSEEEPRRS